VAYYNNLLNMGEPVNVQPLPQLPTASPFTYTDRGLLPLDLPNYSAIPAPIANPSAAVQPLLPISRSLLPQAEIIGDDMGIAPDNFAGTTSPANALAGLNSPFGRVATTLLQFTPLAPLATMLGIGRAAGNAYGNVSTANYSRNAFGLPDMAFTDAAATGLGFNNFDFTDQERADIASMHGTVGDVGAPGAPGALGALGLDPDFAAYEDYSASVGGIGDGVDDDGDPDGDGDDAW
jgi:hypothetical protein